MASYSAARITSDGVIGESSIVVLDPEKWLGKPFPLRDYIDLGEQLVNGRWTVVLYHQSCPKCQTLVAEYEALSEDTLSFDDKDRVALIEIPPFAAKRTDRQIAKSSLHYGRLFHDRDWFAQTPVVLEIVDGVVTHTRMDGD